MNRDVKILYDWWDKNLQLEIIKYETRKSVKLKSGIQWLIKNDEWKIILNRKKIGMDW